MEILLDFLKSLVPLGGLLGGIWLFSGIITGLSLTLWKIWGTSYPSWLNDPQNNVEGVLSTLAMAIGLDCLIGGILWAFFFSIHEIASVYGMLLGGVFSGGCLLLDLVRRCFPTLQKADRRGIWTGVLAITPCLIPFGWALVKGGNVPHSIILGAFMGILLMACIFIAALSNIHSEEGLHNSSKTRFFHYVNPGVNPWSRIYFGILGGGLSLGSLSITLESSYFIFLSAFGGGAVVGTLLSVAAMWGFAVMTGIANNVVGKMLDFVLSPFFIFWRFRTLICQHCLRHTHSFHSTYEHGIRYCEHCHQEVEHRKDPGKVIFMFGILLDKPDGDRIFFLSNPDLEQKEDPFEVSEVYIDTKTCNTFLLERFITHITNYPPEKGIQSVQIFYQGKLDDLGENLKNALRNTFAELHEWGISRNEKQNDRIEDK